MNLDTTFLRSRVGKRMLTLFVLCSLVPITVLAFVSFTHVTSQLNEQSQRRLRQASKALGMAIFERVVFLEAKMKTVAAGLASRSLTSQSPPAPISEDLGARFRGLGVVSPAYEYAGLFGDELEPPRLHREQKEHLDSGKSLLLEERRAGLPPRVLMVRAIDREGHGRGLLLGEIESDYLWGDESTLPPMTQLCILDDSDRTLFCSGESLLSQEVARKMGGSASGQFEWGQEGEEYLAGYWSIPLFGFSSTEWKVVLSESIADVHAPMADFRRTFLLVMLMSLWVVLLLSISQIRRSLVPLEKLQEGTRRIAERDFTSRVRVESSDEFRELADSFNGMAGQLGRQFHTLSTMAEIDRAILSVLDTRSIVDTLLSRMPDVFPCRSVSLSLIDTKGSNRARTYSKRFNPERDTVVETVVVDRRELGELRDNPESLWIRGTPPPHYIPPSMRRGAESWQVFPIFFKKRLAGIMTLGDVDRSAHGREDLLRARQLVDQVAVALSNAHLIEQLDELNWGALVALARTIDAKSPWTLGHSERAAEMAVKIGRNLGLAQKELDNLHRGALLHDIGKIGIPPAILDKRGKLTPEETAVMREHPLIGERILEPIAAYADVIPVVSQHHEWFDGTGYPRGLAGDEISFIARIYAVADVFDALIADRPYRGGLSLETVVDYIEERAGRQFDPKAVTAFLEVIAKEGALSEKIPQPSSVTPA
jgi:HAMP domain-containing protein